jgi:hypothetical protein
MLLIVTGGGIQSEPERRFDMLEMTERELKAAAEESGFKEPWLDDLHLAIVSGLRNLEAGGSIAEGITNTGDMYKDRAKNRFLKMKDADGREYFRVYLGTDDNHNDIFARNEYTYTIYGYFYLDGERKNLEKVLFQVYRVNFIPGRPLYRELRRIVHPSPGVLSMSVEDDPSVKDVASNDPLGVEYFASYETPSPFVEGQDGVPGPVVKLDPVMAVSIKDPVEPIPYESRLKILGMYRSMLMQTSYRLDREMKVIGSKRPIMIRRTLDINT